MTKAIDKFNGGNKGVNQQQLSTVLYQLAKQQEEQETQIMILQSENSDLRNKLLDEKSKNESLNSIIHNHEEYGVLSSKVRVDRQPSKKLDTIEIVRVINDYRAMNLLSGTVKKIDVNKPKELRMLKMEGSYIVGVYDEYTTQINIRTKTIAEFSNECFHIIVDSFKPHR